ncbi:MAG: hypothetical protein LUD81_07860, partial [Clostridiales bacterium]|nr:hypothetical protein [Clostridiales bacterium]
MGEERYSLNKLVLGEEEIKYNFLRKFFCRRLPLNSDVNFRDFARSNGFEISFGSEFKCIKSKTEKGEKRIYKSPETPAGTVISVPAVRPEKYDGYDTVFEIIGYPFSTKDSLEKIKGILKTYDVETSKYVVILYEEDRAGGFTDTKNSYSIVSDAEKNIKKEFFSSFPDVNIKIVNENDDDLSDRGEITPFSEKLAEEYKRAYVKSFKYFKASFDIMYYIYIK